MSRTENSQQERLQRIRRMLHGHRAVSFAEIMEQLGASRPTVFRDIAFLRNRIGLPIVHDRDSGVYRLDRSAGRHEMPGMWFSAAEIHALLSMQSLLGSFDSGGLLSEYVEPLRQRLIDMLGSADDSADEIGRRIRILSAAARPYAPQHFQHIAAALMERRRLNIEYSARSKGDTSQREISPQRLTHYRDNWYLDAWCHLRDELRSFAVDAIKTVKTMDAVAREIPEAQLDAALGAGYGIFAGAEVQWAMHLHPRTRPLCRRRTLAPGAARRIPWRRQLSAAPAVQQRSGVDHGYFEIRAGLRGGGASGVKGEGGGIVEGGGGEVWR